MYHSWGLFYRKYLFQTVGISEEPKTWDQLMDTCKKLKAAGITPFSVGGRDAWTLAGWFDYLDLRLNGNAFRQQLPSPAPHPAHARIGVRRIARHHLCRPMVKQAWKAPLS
ncbi:extracellular solute-binding protein [Caballeronia temeraria]|uniref:Extracellular solute-binding protein n=1 Tax=Caballeronia temeraria TaxID=1777137 RepID=A0A158C757_9BURK|nr:extracellular solute-binding protein [Caballeronia temeraria]